jgi:aldose 1-epimerase
MKSIKNILLTLVAASAFIACNQQVKITKENFGEIDGKAVSLYNINFKDGLDAKVTNYGGIITSLSVADKNGVKEDIVLGYDSLSQYVDKSPFFGALIGRFGNRIAKGQFTLDGNVYNLEKNNNGNTLHGGVKGFDKVVWEVVETKTDDKSAIIVLKYISPDGEEGYPGTLTTTVTYTFTANSLNIAYSATTDKSTVVNLTQHTYFNLSGNVKGDINDHVLQLDADTMLPVDELLIPTGELLPVAGTPFDFTTPKKIGKDINEDDVQLTNGMGYDHCWVLNGGQTAITRRIGSLYHPTSGRQVEIFTTEPAIQFYSGNFLDGTITGKGKLYDYRFGLCLETQHFPDSPNQPSFPSVVLDPEQTYSTETTYLFSVK